MLLKIATWNIGGGFISGHHPHVFDKDDLQYFGSEIQKTNSDVVCLQEVHSPVDKRLSSQAETLASILGFSHFYSCPYNPSQCSHLQENQILSLGIISRYKICSANYVQLINPNLKVIRPEGNQWASHDKGYILATIDFNGCLISVITGHNVPFRRFNRDFMDNEFTPIRQQIQEIIVSSLPAPTIFAGDMNYEEIDALLPKVFTAGFKKLFPQKVVTDPLNFRHLDHILFSSDWDVFEARVVRGKADHYMCCGSLTLGTCL